MSNGTFFTASKRNVDLEVHVTAALESGATSM